MKKLSFGKKILGSFCILALLLFSIALLMITYNSLNQGITTFEECIAAGNPAMESYPRQCIADGKTFIEQVMEETACLPEQRNSEACIQVYEPVCGWNDPEKIQCIKYPCAQDYSNICEACSNENILHYTKGKCPK